MPAESFYNLIADALLVLHGLFVAFVGLGLVATYLGYWLSWAWVRNFWFRLLHLTAISIVVLQSWMGMLCPLTLWEMRLRELARSATYEGSFVQHWVHVVLYYEAPEWVFVIGYTLFGGLVAVSWFVVPPRRRR